MISEYLGAYNKSTIHLPYLDIAFPRGSFIFRSLHMKKDISEEMSFLANEFRINERVIISLIISKAEGHVKKPLVDGFQISLSSIAALLMCVPQIFILKLVGILLLAKSMSRRWSLM